MGSEYRLIVPTAILVLSGSLSAFAQTPPATSDSLQTGSLEEVVVTAERRNENLQAVPIAVEVLSAQQLEASGITTTTDLSIATPGLTTQRTGGNFEPRLRGIGASANGPGIENPVALVVDGVYYANQHFGIEDLVDVGQIAVLKGPQGTLFGRNATGGVIQITTQDPTQEFQGLVRTGLDNYLTSRSNVYVSGGVTDQLATSVSASYIGQGHGYGDDVVTGLQVHKIDKDIFFRSKWLYRPTDDTDVRVILDYSYSNGTTDDNYQPLQGYAQLFPTVSLKSAWDTEAPANSGVTFRGGGLSVNIDHDFVFAKLVSISAYRQADTSETFWASPIPTPAEFLAVPTESLQLTQELQLISPESRTFNWVAGLYYFHSNAYTNPTSIYLLGPLAPTPTSLGIIDVYTRTPVDSPAAYFQTTTQVLPHTDLTVGLRYTIERRTFTARETGTLNDDTFLGNLPLPTLPPSEKFSKLTWRFALDHNFRDDLMGYVSYNRGFKSGGYNAFDPTNPPYGPEVLDAYEVGLKSEWFDRTLRINGAAFYYNYSNIQVSRYGQTATIYNGASAEDRGLDLDAEWRLGNFGVHGGLEWLHTQFTSFPNAIFSMPLPGGGVTTVLGNAHGNALPYAPNITVDIGIDYSVPIRTGTLAMSIINSYDVGYYSDVDNVVRIPAFDLINASLKWSSTDDRFEVSLWTKNLLNKAHASYIATIAPFGYEAEYGGNPPRLYGITGTLRLGRASL